MDSDESLKENEAWRLTRHKNCLDPNGWLTLAGLCWLEEGDNTFGGGAENKVIFEVSSAPHQLGAVTLDSKAEPIKAIFRPVTGVEVRHQGQVVTEPLGLLHDEQPSGPTVLTFGPLSWFLVLRSGRYAFRLKDSESAVLKNFKGMEMFPIELKWRIEADFVPYSPPRVIQCPNALGVIEDQNSPGRVEFVIDGQPIAIEAMGRDDKLFLIFNDATSGKTTYGGGRYLYSSAPVTNNKVIVDFNQAYNPPCVFTDFATCTYAPKQNRLTSLAIEAGEKKFSGGPHNH